MKDDADMTIMDQDGWTAFFVRDQLSIINSK